MTSRLLVSGLAACVPFFALAAGPVKFPLKPQDRVQISLAKAQVTVSATREEAVTLIPGANCRELQSETRENELVLREADLMKPRSDAACILQILVPAHALSLHVLEGSIAAQKLNNELLLHVQKGKVFLRDSAGSAIIHVQRGEVGVTDFQGRLRLDLLQAPATIKGLVGDLELEALGGDHLVEKPKGNLRITQSQGTLKISGGSGSLQLETQRSTLITQGFSGRIEGQTQEGVLSLTLAADPDVNLKTQSGRITLQAPPNSGASVNIVSAEGELAGPSAIPVSKEGSGKALRGRLRGEGKGSLIVRAQEGSVTVK